MHNNTFNYIKKADEEGLQSMLIDTYTLSGIRRYLLNTSFYSYYLHIPNAGAREKTLVSQHDGLLRVPFSARVKVVRRLAAGLAGRHFSSSFRRVQVMSHGGRAAYFHTIADSRQTYFHDIFHWPCSFRYFVIVGAVGFSHARLFSFIMLLRIAADAAFVFMPIAFITFIIMLLPMMPTSL